MVEKHEISKILEHYSARLPNRQGWTQMKCPFHGDSHASASVNLKDNAFICHACGIKGDTYSIIMQHEGVDFREALAIAETITGERGGFVRSKYSSSPRVSGKARSVLRGRKERWSWSSE